MVLFAIPATSGTARATAIYKVTSVASGGTTLLGHPKSISLGGCVTLKGTNFYPGDVENLYIGPWSNTAGFKSLKSFDDNFTTGAIAHRVCLSSMVFLAGTYALIVVGSTYGTGVVKLTIT